MNNTSMIALGFGIIATTFVLSLLKSIIVLLGYKMKADGSDFKALIKIFKIPLITLAIFIIFIVFVVPSLVE